MISRPVAAIAVMLLLTVPTLAGCSLFDPQRDLTLRDVVNSEDDASDVTTQAKDITDTACVSPRDCVEAYSTVEADYFRFESRKRAEEYG